MATKSNTKKKIRVQFDFSEQALQALDDLVEQSQAASRAEVVRNALRLYGFFIQVANRDGSFRYIENGKTKELRLI